MFVATKAATKIFKVDIDPDVADGIRKVFDDRGAGYASGAEALFRWMMEQDEMLQLLILGKVPSDYHKQVAQLILRRISNGKQKPRTIILDDGQERGRKTG